MRAPVRWRCASARSVRCCSSSETVVLTTVKQIQSDKSKKMTSKAKTSNEVQADIHRESSETINPNNRTQDSHRGETMLVSDSRSNEQTQLQRSLEQGFASMMTGLTAAIKEAFKTLSDRFEYDMDETELLSEVDDGDIDGMNVDDNGRQNDSGSQGKPEGTNVQRMIERAKVQDKT